MKFIRGAEPRIPGFPSTVAWPSSPSGTYPMALALTTNDLARLEAASRLLLSPFSWPDVATWLQTSGRAVRDLIAAERVVVLTPGTDGRYYSEDAPEVAGGVHDFIEGVSPGGVHFSDPVVQAWYHLRRRTGQEVLTWEHSRHLVESHGYRMADSPIVSDVLQGQRFHDFVALVHETDGADAMIWPLHSRRGGFAFGEATPAVLGLLAPSFRAGLAAVRRLGAHRVALDTVSEPLAAFDAAGRELHRNAALIRLLDADPERERLAFEFLALVRSLRTLGFPLRSDAPAGPCRTERTVQTARGTYTLRGTLLPPGAFDADEAVLVSVQTTAGSRLPDPTTLRARFGLTKREAEVALLVAEGLKTDEIAARLFISPHTARHHVENLMAKLEVTSRAAVAARLL